MQRSRVLPPRAMPVLSIRRQIHRATRALYGSHPCCQERRAIRALEPDRQPLPASIHCQQDRPRAGRGPAKSASDRAEQPRKPRDSRECQRRWRYATTITLRFGSSQFVVPSCESTATQETENCELGTFVTAPVPCCRGRWRAVPDRVRGTRVATADSWSPSGRPTRRGQGPYHLIVPRAPCFHP